MRFQAVIKVHTHSRSVTARALSSAFHRLCWRCSCLHSSYSAERRWFTAVQATV